MPTGDEPNAEPEQYADDSAWRAQRWAIEFAAAKKAIDPWHELCDTILKRYLDERESTEHETRWNFFPSNIQLKQATLYGRPPQVNVSRRFDDAKDSIGRVASEMLERLLNTDIQRDTDDYASSLRYSLFDRLCLGFGAGRLRYVSESEAPETEEPTKEAIKDESTGAELAPAVPAEQVKTFEDIETQYLHWQDVLWSPARTWGEVRWIAFRSQMTRKQLVKRFGDKLGKRIPLNSKKAQAGEEKSSGKSNPWGQSDVWEIWDKDCEDVTWFVEGFGETLEVQEDPYQLDGFFPMPPPMFANLTTSKLVPHPDYLLAKDIYNEIDEISSRITLLEKVIAIRGSYDKNSPELANLLSPHRGNRLLPSDNWAQFQEKGGFKGSFDIFPLDMVIAALDKLRDYRQELISVCAQVDGSSDIVRGQQMENGTPGEAQIKARFAGIRMQALQEEFANFASGLQQIRAEMISKLFDVNTIVERSNAKFMFDDALAMQAAQLIKDKHSLYRIEIEPEALAQADFAQMKQERTEWLGALSGFIQVAAPTAQTMPGTMPFLLECLKWTMGAFRGSRSIGGILDQAIAQVEKMAQRGQGQQQQQQDPKLMAVQAKAQNDQQKGLMDLEKEKFKLQADGQRMQMEVQTEDAKQRSQTEWNLKEQAAKDQMRTQQRATELSMQPAHNPTGRIP